MRLAYYLGWGLTWAVSRGIFRIRVSGRQHVPVDGGFIIAANHISYFDPPLVGTWCGRTLYYMAKKELFRSKLFGVLMHRVNALPVRRGVVDREVLKLCVQTIERGFGLAVFPEGTRSKASGFLQPKPGVGMIAMQARCPIIPAYIHGSNRLGACFWGRDTMSITFGEPLSSGWVASFPPGKEGYMKIAEVAMERIGRLRDRASVAKAH